MPKKWNFAEGPFESRRAYWDLVAKMEPDVQQRVGQLMCSIVFKNELPEMLADLQFSAVAEVTTADYGTTWTAVHENAARYTINNGAITVLADGLYEIALEGYWKITSSASSPRFLLTTNMRKNGSSFWQVEHPSITYPDEVRSYHCIVHRKRILTLQSGDIVDVALTRWWSHTPGSQTGVFHFTVVALGEAPSA